MSERRRWGDVLAPLGLLVVGALVAFWPMLRSGFALMQVDPADTRLVNAVLEWVALGRGSPWQQPFFFPEPNVGAFTEVMLSVAPFYAAWRWAGLAPDSAFQAWLLSMAALTYGSGWLLFRRALGLRAVPSAVGAFFTTFAGVRLNQANHPHLWPFFFTLLAVSGVVVVLKGTSRPWAWWGLVASGVVLQVYASVQLGWFLVFALALAAGWALLLPGARRTLLAVLRTQGAPMVAWLAAAGLALLPLGRAYLAAGTAVGFRTWDEARSMLPQAQSWLYQGPHHWLYGWLAGLGPFARLPMEGEHRVGLGLVTTSVVAWVLWGKRREPGWAVLGLTALSVVVLTTVHGSFSPWQAVMAVVPGANGIRAAGRLALLLVLPVGLALATLLQERRGWAPLALVGWCLLEQGQRVPDSYDKASQRAEVARVVRAVPSGCRAFFLAAREDPPYDEKTQLNAMWAALELGVPTVNGYSGNVPRGWALAQHTLREVGDEARLRAALAQWLDGRGVNRDQVCFVVAPQPRDEAR